MSKTRVLITPTSSAEFAEKDNILDEVATRQRSIDFYSALYYLPNPDPVLKKQGTDISVYNDLLIDPTVTAAVARWKDGVQELEWDIDRGKAKSKQAKLIKEIFNDLDSTDESGGLHRIIGEILDARLFGFQPCEVMWKKSGNYIVPADIIAKPQEWFAFDQDSRLLFRTQNNLMGEPVPDYKFICPRYGGSYKNPYGKPVLSSCFWPVTFKKGGLKFFVQFAEKYGMPYIIGEHSFTTEKDVEKFVDDLDNMVADGVIAIAQGKQRITIEHTGTQASSDIYAGLIGVMREEINHAILNHSSATSSTPGKLGNESSALNAAASVINSGKRLVSQALNVVIKWTLELNGLSGDIPRFVFYEEEDVDLATAQRDEILTKTGVTFNKSHYVKAYGLDEEDFELATSTPAPAGPPASFAEDTRTEDQIVTDELIEMLGKGQMVKAVGDELVKPVLDFIDGAASYEEAMGGLLDLYPTMNIATLQKLLTNAQASAFLMGQTHAQE